MVSFGEMQIGNMMNALLWCGNTIDLNKMAHATMITRTSKGHSK